MLSRKILHPGTLPLMWLRTSNAKVLYKYSSGIASINADLFRKKSEIKSKPCQFRLSNFSSNMCAKSPTENLYDIRKYGHSLPENNRSPDFPVLNSYPTGIFRNSKNEVLGPQGQAGKYCCYKNPEYFSFHHMTYYDMHLYLRGVRKPCAATGRKPF